LYDVDVDSSCPAPRLHRVPRSRAAPAQRLRTSVEPCIRGGGGGGLRRDVFGRESMAALALPSPTDPKTWHADTRDVFLIVGSKLSGVAQSGDKVAMSFLDEIRPFERARISGGLRDLLAMDIVVTHYDEAANAFSMSSGCNFAAASKAHDIPKTVNISHLKSAATPRR
jgi:hypothetical protein